jgi:hypothetical protein
MILLSFALFAGCSEAAGPLIVYRSSGILQLLPEAAQGMTLPDRSVRWDVPPDDHTITPTRTIEAPRHCGRRHGVHDYRSNAGTG